MKETRLVAVNDLHTGSKYSPCPENWKFGDGSTYQPNKAQAWLYDKYLECVNEFGKPDYLLINGDAPDGNQHFNYAREVWTSDPYEQMRLAVHEIDLWKAKQKFVTVGSRYHVELGGMLLEKFIAARVKAKRFGWTLNFELDGKRCNFAHEIGVSISSWQYRSTSLARELVLDRLQNADKSANLVLRAHAHYFCGVFFSDQLAMVTPGFQGQTPYAARRMPTVKSKVGIVSITFPSLNFDYKTWDGPMLPEEELDAKDFKVAEKFSQEK